MRTVRRSGSAYWRGGLAAAWLALALIVGSVPRPAEGARVLGAAVQPDATGITVKVEMDGATGAPSFFALGTPMRLVVDLAGASVAARTVEGSGVVTRVRLAQFAPGIARLVIDLNAPARITKVAPDGTGRSVLLTLLPASAEEFAQAVRQGRSPVGAAEGSVRAIRAAARAADWRPLVVIDAGHGGHDTGALSVWEGRREKDVTLAIARAIQRELDRSGRVRTALTREDDRFIPLGERVAIARAKGAQLFISVHADAAASPDARGATVYTLSEVASDREAARLAARENRSDLIAGVDLGVEDREVAGILLGMAQRGAMNESSAFAGVLLREMEPHVRLKTSFHRFAGFRVLRGGDMPAVLLETGYLTNEEDARFLFSKEGQRAIAKGVTRAVEHHLLPQFAASEAARAR